MKIGSTVVIYGREVLLVDCDEYTKQWYWENLRFQQVPLPVRAGQKSMIHHSVPDHNGIGSEEDTF